MLKMEEECDYHRHSPFYHIKSYIKFFNIFLGLPLKATSKSYDEFVFSPMIERIKIILLVGTAVILHLVPIIFLFTSTEHSYFAKYYKEFGVSKLDIFVAFGEYQCATLLSVIFFFYFFSKCSKKLNLLLASMEKLNHDLEDAGYVIDYNELKRNPRNIIIFGHLGRFANTCFATAMYWFVCNGFIKDGKRYTLVTIDRHIAIKLLPLVICNGIITNSPYFSSTEFILYYLTNLLRSNVDMISGLISKFGKCRNEHSQNGKVQGLMNMKCENSNEGLDKNRWTILRSTLDMPFKVLKIISLFDDTFAGIVLTVYVGTLALITVSSYGLASVVLSFSRMNIQEAVTFAYLRGSWCFLLASGNSHKLLRLTKYSNALHTSLLELKNNLNEILIETLDSSSTGFNVKEIEICRQKIWIFKQELQLINSPLSPFSAFDVSNRTLISAFATIITYLIVLIQFKVSEFDNDINVNFLNNTSV